MVATARLRPRAFWLWVGRTSVRVWGVGLRARLSPATPRPPAPRPTHGPWCWARRTLELRRRARAMQSNCLSPTEKFSPFSSTSACSLCGNFRICRSGRQGRSRGPAGGRTNPSGGPCASCPSSVSLRSSPPTHTRRTLQPVPVLEAWPCPSEPAAARPRALPPPPPLLCPQPTLSLPPGVPSHETRPPCPSVSVVPGGRRLRERRPSPEPLRSPSCSGRSSPGRPRSPHPCAGQRGPGSTCPGRRPCSATT